MFLKNYTSDVPISQTVYRIEQVLLKCGVTGIMKEYGVGQAIVALTFQIDFGGGNKCTIRLPVNVQKAWDALWLNYVDGDSLSPDGMHVYRSYKKKHKANFRDQAERTAWKIVQDWVEVQMSMIQMQQADFREVFMPYLWDGKQSFYQRVEASGFAGLLPEKSEAA